MKNMRDSEVFLEQARALKMDAYEEASVSLRNSIGPATERLNRFFSDTGGASFYDYPYLHTDKFVLKYTRNEWRGILCRRKVDNDAAVEYADADMEFVHQHLYRFQKGCELAKLPTQSPHAFFRTFCAENAEQGDFFHGELAVLNTFLYAASDLDFLFDSAVVRQLPKLFVSRTALNAIVKKLPNHMIFDTQPDAEVYPLLNPTPEQMRRSIVMAEQQCRELQLMLPGCAEYGKFIEQTMLPAIKHQQKRIWSFLVSPTIIRWQACDYPSIGKICMECFLWHLRSRKHLSLNKQKRELLDNAIRRTQERLADGGSYQALMEELLSLSQQDAWGAYSPLLIYRVMIQFRNDIARNNLPNSEKLPVLDTRHPTVQLKSNADTARKEYRCNILFFQKLCSGLSGYLTKEETDRIRFAFEFTEPYSEELYAADDVVSAEPDSDLVRDYILYPTKGNKAGHVYQDLAPIHHRIRQNMTISPYDLFPFYRWHIERDDGYRRLYDTGKDNGLAQAEGRWRTKSFWATVCGAIEHYRKEHGNDYEKLRLKYYQEAFAAFSGYGSGLPTYEWTFSVMEISDYLIEQCPTLKELDSAFDDSSELLEIAIHKYLLDDMNEWILKDVCKAGKQFFYDPLLLQVTQDSNIPEESILLDDDGTVVRGGVAFQSSREEGDGKTSVEVIG